jgi:hypothetical protein
MECNNTLLVIKSVIEKLTCLTDLTVPYAIRKLDKVIEYINKNVHIDNDRGLIHLLKVSEKLILELDENLIKDLAWFIESYPEYGEKFFALNACVLACNDFKENIHHTSYSMNMVFECNIYMNDDFMEIYGIDEIPKYCAWNHIVVKYKDIYIDFTAKQYNEDLPFPFIYKFED